MVLPKQKLLLLLLLRGRLLLLRVLLRLVDHGRLHLLLHVLHLLLLLLLLLHVLQLLLLRGRKLPGYARAAELPRVRVGFTAVASSSPSCSSPGSGSCPSSWLLLLLLLYLQLLLLLLQLRVHHHGHLLLPQLPHDRTPAADVHAVVVVGHPLTVPLLWRRASAGGRAAKHKTQHQCNSKL